MAATSENDREFNNIAPKPRPARGFTLVEFLVVVAVIAFLIALLVPASRGSREAARRSQCVNNLKAIAQALRSYQQEYKAFPPACTVDANGRPLHSWRTLLLPYLDQASLYQQIDLSKPWNDPANAKARETQLPVFLCPSADGPPDRTPYLAVVGPNACFLPSDSRRLAEIGDEHGSTLMLIEADDEHAVPWMAPVDADESLVLSLGPTTKLHHSGGFNACLVDGSVRFLKASLAADVRRALLSIAGGENVSPEEW